MSEVLVGLDIKKELNDWKQNKNFKKKILKDVPINRFGTPEEIAYCVLFLSSEYSSFTNGANFIIDGGQSS